jgi:oxygen-independent coproporphyrinogen III oxidase
MSTIATIAAPTLGLDQGVEFDAAVIGKLSQPGPHYTSYPTADRFTSAFGFGNFLEALAALRMRGGRRPLSLYIHIPFCETLCYYCSCNKIVTKDRGKAATYLSYLKQEIAMQGKLFGGMNQIAQLRFGGGTPTYLSERQMDDLMQHLRHNFEFADDAVGEYAIEVDPRTVSPQRVQALRRQGFNRISLGIQDFDPQVQQAVNRVQSEQHTLAVIEAARAASFRSVSIDLIYGLPKQTLATMEQTMAKVVAAGPDRIALYNYAHLPRLFKSQRRIVEADLPDAAAKLDLLGLCVARLTKAGYVYIGMDHFAKPNDELAVAQRQGRLQRSFQSYSTHADSDLIACGVSAISSVGAVYSQNEDTLDAYYERLDEGKLPIARGIKLDTDDLLRRIIIQLLMCNFELSIESIEQTHPIEFHQYFAAELAKLDQFVADGLVTIDRQWLSVTPRGRLLIRAICMVFDSHLAATAEEQPTRARRLPKPI